VNQQWPRPIPLAEMLPPGGLAVIARDKLLLAALAAAPIADFELERILIGLRFACLAAARDDNGGAEHEMLPLACALAQQCLLNGYVWPQSDDETTRLRELQNAAAAALQARQALHQSASRLLPATSRFKRCHSRAHSHAIRRPNR